MSKHLDKSKALSITRLSQVGFALLACGAGAVAYVGLPLAQPPTEKDFVVEDAGPVAAPQGGQAETQADILGSASRLARVANAPKAPQVEAATPSDVKPPESAPAAGLSDVKYLGFANVGSLRLALLNVNSKQRFVREGQLIDAERVKSIEPDAVTLSQDQTDRRIALEERSGERITRVRGTPTIAANPPQATPMKLNGVQAARGIGEGIRGLSRLPDEYLNWPPAYQHRFDRVVNGLLQQGPFPDEFSLIEKAKAAMQAEGYNPDDKESMMKLEETDRAEQKSRETGDYKTKKEK